MKKVYVWGGGKRGVALAGMQPPRVTTTEIATLCVGYALC